MNPVRSLLVAAGELVARDHTATQLAVDSYGRKVRPLHPAATAWSTAGVLCLLAPARSAHDPKVYADSTEVAWQAWVLLEQAAFEHGFPSAWCPDEGSPARVDQAGPAAVAAMFRRALVLAPESTSRSRSGSRAGSLPRGADAV